MLRQSYLTTLSACHLLQKFFSTQIHEPVLATSAATAFRLDAQRTYQELAAVGVPLHLVVPFDDLTEEVYSWVTELPVTAIGLDFCGVPGSFAGNRTAQLIGKLGFPSDKRLGAGVIDGRSVWADDGTAAGLVAGLRALLGKDQPIGVQVRLHMKQNHFFYIEDEEIPL